MNTNTTSRRAAFARRFNSLHAIAAAGLLLGGLSAATSRAAILYVGDLNATIQKFTSGGVGSVFADANDGLYAPQGLAFDSANNLYVANELNHSIRKITPGGVSSVFADSGDGLTYPRGLAFDSAGNLYVANGDQTIRKITPGGVTSVFVAITGTFNPIGLAFDTTGNLYAAIQSRIEKITPNGVSSLFASSGNGYPAGLAFDSAGNLYAANYAVYGTGNYFTIDKFTAGGTRSLFASSGLSQPWGLAFDDAGNLYVGNNGNGSVGKFTPDGVGSVFASYEDGLNGPTFPAFTNDAGVPLLQPGGRLVPEPSTLVMISLGLPALLGATRLGRRKV